MIQPDELYDRWTVLAAFLTGICGGMLLYIVLQSVVEILVA